MNTSTSDQVSTLRNFQGILALAAITAFAAPAAPAAAAPLAADLQIPPVPSAPRPQAGTARHVMVAAANPLAVEAGEAVLRRGGSAIDAAVAVQAVLGLVEPQSSGLGGGAFLVWYDAKTHQATAYDGRETAPAGATAAQFTRPDGTLYNFAEAITGGISTGVPGAIAMLDRAQHDHGHLPWSTLFATAQSLATTGFTVSPRLAMSIRFPFAGARAPDAVAYFTKPDGTQYAAGDTLKNPAYAQSLGQIAQNRANALLTGPIAADIVARVHQGPLPSTMTLADLAAYQPHVTPALCAPYRTVTICTPQAPSGGPALQEALGILAHTDLPAHGPSDPQGWFLFAEASRLAYADRDRYEGDPAFIKFPQTGLLAPDYLAARAALIGPRAMANVTYGHPAGAPTFAPDGTPEPGGTSHVVIVDAAGNALSMTTTVESIFGSGRMVDGFFLNNQLTDFSFAPRAPNGTPAANALAPGKRPRSTMAPVIVLSRNGRFKAALGSPGGSSILAYNLKGVVGLIDWGLAPQQIAALPNLVAHGPSFTADPFPPALLAALAARGMPLDTARGEASGLQVLVRRPDGSLSGGADPRREGEARGF